MNESILFLIVLLGVGTYLTRALPFIFKLDKWLSEDSQTLVSQFFQLMGPALIAALFAFSLDSSLFSHGISNEVIGTAIGFSAVVATFVLWKNVGLCVFSGILAYAIFSYFTI